MVVWAKVLHRIINGKEELCPLCYEISDENRVKIQDDVTFNEECTENIKLIDILSTVLGEETCNRLSPNEAICSRCTKLAVSSYQFITTTKGNLTAWNNILDSLINNIKNTEENINQKTLYLLLDPNYYHTEQYCDKNIATSTILAVKRLNAILEKHNIKSELIKKEIGEEKRKCHSVKMKTEDMLYDKNNKLNLKCKVCLKIYPTLSNLRNHYIRVHAPKDFECSICKRCFGSLALLEAHKSESHVTLVCTECGRTFYNRHTLKMHEISHHLKIVCKDCGRIYKSQTTYKKHLDLNICSQTSRASPANAKYTCDHCKKRYTQKVSLRVHIQYEHGNYKAHECKWCKKKFWAPSRLKAHIVKHTQEKRFQCTICSGKFVTKESLLYHTRSHTGEKPYKCDHCDQKFVSASRKADHTKRHHTNAIFQCMVCKIKYTTRICLEKHMKTHIVDDITRPEENGPEIKFKLPPVDNLYFVSNEEPYFVPS